MKSKMTTYDHRKIEKKWQKRWEEDGLYEASNKSKKPRYYSLIEFPYPSGEGLHVGHIRSNTAMDIISRKRRMEGYNVLYPIGWDAFGLPTENYAIKTGIHPVTTTKKNTNIFRKQLKECGFSFDWSREINTTDPEYYKWTQWIFLQLLKAGLAYKKKMPINWCISCKIGLANEEVIDNHCERCGGETDKREKEQWMLAITKYAERLDKDLDLVDYPRNIKLQQRNWIGRSEGAEIEFTVVDTSQESALSANGHKVNLQSKPIHDLLSIKVFTTRPDTIFGATYLVLAPEHEIIKKLKSKIKNYDEIEKYVINAKQKVDVERTTEGREKTGIKLEGITAINPANKKELPIFIADYVLSHYGTGAIMAVPAHDERDFEFAGKYALPVIPVVADGLLINSLQFNGSENTEVFDEIIKFVGGQKKTTYKLRDWIFSRQRYWGEPIPVIHCSLCGVVPVLEKDLPVRLPNVKNYKPTETGESPLALIDKWVNVKCPKCGGKAKRETDTMPNWAGSSWYYLSYCFRNKKLKSKIKSEGLTEFKKYFEEWLPVDWYNGGMEHVTLHLLYSRFWHKFLYDQGFVPTPEPYKKRTAHGFILGSDGQKMSKSRGNVINPDSIIKLLGADTLRVYEMFMGPFADAISWNTDSVAGSRRFLERIWRLQFKVQKNNREGLVQIEVESLERLLNQTIKKVSDDIEEMKFNTAVSAMMILLNEMEKREQIPIEAYHKFLIILSPFAPHITEELSLRLGNKSSILLGARKSIHLFAWPEVKTEDNKNFKIKIVIQINSKVRDEVEVDRDIPDDLLRKIVLERSDVKRWLSEQKEKRIIVVKNKLVNIVI